MIMSPVLRRWLIGGTIVFTVVFAGAGFWLVQERMTEMSRVGRKPPTTDARIAAPTPASSGSAPVKAAAAPAPAVLAPRAAPPSDPPLTREQSAERDSCFATNSSPGLTQPALMLVAAACHQLARQAETDKARCVLGMRNDIAAMGADMVLKSCQADWRFKPSGEQPIPARRN
jgi:hypothetical protein